MAVFAQFVINAWFFVGGALFLYGLMNCPVLAVFAGHRIAQLRDREFDLRASVPTHAALHFYAAGLYGIILPAFYFLTVRLRHELATWHLGAHVNYRATIAIGLLCMIWLACRMIRAAASGRRLWFGGPLDRVMGAAALGLCLWFHIQTLAEWPMALAKMKTQMGGAPPLLVLFFAVIYPQSHFLGATVVYGFAFAEACRFPAEAAAPLRRRVMRYAFSASAVAIVFAPWWLSLPRETHRDAMHMIEQRRDSIADAAEKTQLDPRLIAGIIYVAQTRDHPRWTGKFIDAFGMELNNNPYDPDIDLMFDRSVGLCQIRLSTHEKLRKIAVNAYSSTEPWPPSFTVIATSRWNTLQVNQGWSERESYKILMDPAKNLRCAVFMLHMLRGQWRQAGFPIDDRPEILATLYNIGFERSKPHGAPKANDFGRRVKAFMETDECKKLFEKAAAK